MQYFGNTFQERSGLIRLLKESGRFDFLGDFPKLLFLACGQEDDRHISKAERAEAFGHEKANRVGHPDIHEDQIRSAAEGEFQALLAIARGANAVALGFEANRQRGCDFWIVVNDEYVVHAEPPLSGLRI